MAKIKLEHIDNLARGKKSGAKIGSRGTPHHLYKYEQEKYERALDKKYLEITTKERVNLQNLWEKVCVAKGWTNYILVKDTTKDYSSIQKNSVEIMTGDRKVMKQYIQKLILDEDIG